MLKKLHFVGIGLLTVLVLYLSKSLFLNINNHTFDWLNFVIIGGLAYWTFLWGYNALTNRKSCPIQRTEQTRSFRNIEFLRVVFTIGILLFHFVPKMEIWNRGTFGVAFFFMLSGFFMTLTFSPEKSIPDLIKKRLIQFIPLIILGSALRILFVEQVKVADMLAEFFLITSTGMFKLCRYNSVSWYISVLFWGSLFYIYLLKTKKRETVNLTIGILTFLGTVACIKRGTGYRDFLGNEGDIGFIFDMRFIYGLTTLGWGYFVAVIYNLWNKTDNPKNKIFWTVLETFVLLYSVLFMFIERIYPGNLAFIFLSFAALILLFLLKKGYISNWFNKRIWVNLARYSLAVYLVQGITVWELFPRFQKAYPDFVQNYPIITICGTVLCCIAFGVWAHHVIEKPCAKALKKIWK